MNAENFLSMFKFDSVEYSIDLKKYCPDVNKIGLNNNPDNKTSSDKKYSNQIESKYYKEESIVETTYNVNSKDKTDWINLDCQDKINIV